MGLPMVQKDTRRRSNLILGVLLALLLGVAAGFFVLAVPIRMLETVTTLTRLSKLMVQAEPPISPNDRTLLAVLAGILAAGIGWVLIDWLLFGRAGMSTLIKPREDDYEDEDGDHFRPTDPLDLVSSVPLPAQDWVPPASGDARRPLSARTDIGDPPKPASPFGMPAIPQPGLDRSPNPFGQILPGVGGEAPPLHSNVPPPLGQPMTAATPPGQQATAMVWGASDPTAPGAPLPASWPPLDLSTLETPPRESVMPEASPVERAVASTPGWLPVPGLRPDGGQPPLTAGEPVNSDIAPLQVEPVMTAPTPVPPPLIPQPPVDLPTAAPQPQPIFAPSPAPSTAPPPAFELPVTPAQVAAAPVSPQIAPTPIRATSEPGFDKVRLEELLARLERGLQNRRAAAAQPPARVEPPVLAPAHQAAALAAMAPRVPPPAAYAAPMPEVSPPIHTEPVAAQAPIPGPTPAPFQPVAPAPEAISTPPLAPIVPPSPAFAAESVARNDALLDQPLHVTLDLLRSMVKR